MATFTRFEDIEAWQSGRELTKQIYSVSREHTFSRDFALRDQIRRAAISITSNIAEGFERQTTREFIRFLFIAKGSSGEVRSQLYCALDEGYLTPQSFDELFDMASSTSRQLAGLISYLKSYEQTSQHS
ncbi:MAG: four helix bundle protein [Bacteroidetes bacterium]|nr:four helix bundle protein [Bacteroidota bacterium]